MKKLKKWLVAVLCAICSLCMIFAAACTETSSTSTSSAGGSSTQSESTGTEDSSSTQDSSDSTGTSESGTSSGDSQDSGSSESSDEGGSGDQGDDQGEDEEGVTYISTAAELIALRAEAELTGTYKLKADIDLAGYTLDSPTAVVKSGATFDGQGYTISNAIYSASSKEGLLFKTIEGGTVTNIRFLNCVVTSSSESAAILAGECNGSATISKIEFNSCTVTTSNTYAGLIFARSEAKTDITITMSEITAKNGCTTSCSQYGGFLVGDITATTNLVFKDLDVEGEFADSTGNGSFIAGRTRGGTVSVENAVISATMPEKSSIGIFSGNSSLTSLTVKNVLIVKSNLSNLYQSTKAPTTVSVSGLYAVSGVTVDQAETTAGEDTATFLKETLGFDFTDVWTTEGTSGYRLIASSANEKSEGAVISSLKVSTGNATTRYATGSTVSTSGVVVTGIYSDGVQLVLDSSEYTIDTSAVDTSTAGTYTVTITSTEDNTVTITYEVSIVDITGYTVVDEFMTKVYLVGDALDTSGLVVYSDWSDGEQEEMTQSSTGYSIDIASYDMTAAGTYNVKISYGTYDDVTIQIAVIADTLTPASNQVSVNVDATQSAIYDNTNGATFNNVQNAIDYLEALQLDNDVVKVVNVGAGTYKAKITTDLYNLTLKGANTTNEDDLTVLTYSAVESTEDIVNGGAYGLNCATLQVNGEGFTAENITIRNDFDYINDSAKESSPQGVALTIAGDKAILKNVHLYGNQDTLYLKTGRAYFYDCLIEGNVDFIFGQATGIAYFDNCEIRAISRYAVGSESTNNGYVTAMKADTADKPDYGYIFSECNFTAEERVKDGSMSLGRPWGAAATVAMIDCTFSSAYSTLAYDGSAKSRWYDMSGNSPVNADFCEYGSTGDGAITEAVTGGKVLTADEAANYTIDNIFAATNGKCTWSEDWNPVADSITVTISDGTAEIGTVSVYSGKTITETKVISAISASIPEGYELDSVYTDSACTIAFDYTTVITVATTLYVTYKPADLTVTESVTYSVANGDFKEATSGTTYIGKLVAEGALTANGDWYIVGGTISATIQSGSTISVTVYATDSVIATVGGTAVELTLGSDTSSGYVYSYTATADCTVVLTNNSTTLYVKSIVVDVPVIYSIGDTINLTATTSSDINLQGNTGSYLGMDIDATNGQFKGNSNSVKVTTGTIIYINSAYGATAEITWYSGYAGEATITTSTEGLITITITNMPDGGAYITSIAIVKDSSVQTSTTYTVNYTATADTSGESAVASTNKFEVSYTGDTDADANVTFSNSVSTIKTNQAKSTSDNKVSYTYAYEIKSNKTVTVTVGAGVEDVTITIYVSQSTSSDTRTVYIGTDTSSTSSAVASLAIGGETGVSIDNLYAVTATLTAGKTYYIWSDNTCHLYDVIVTYTVA